MARPADSGCPLRHVSSGAPGQRRGARSIQHGSHPISFGGVTVDERQRYERGLEVRREVLGDAHVDASLGRLTEFNREFQDLLTRYAWGEIWTRPGLPRQTRSLVTMAMLVSLGRDEEPELHLRASEAAGASRDDVREVLLQTAIYCGVPAANNAFKLAEKVFSA